MTATDAPGRADAAAEHRKDTLDSGVRVITERVPGVRSVALGFWILGGSVIERDEEAGISHLLEHMLFRGTERYGSEEIDQIFDAMGAEVNAGTDKESTSLYTRVLDGHLERAFDVMGDMVWRPRFGELETEREVVLEEIAMYEDDPQDRVFEELGRAVFGGHPLGRPVIGTAQVVRAATREQLAAFHAARYTPGEIVISAAGSLEHERIVELARAAAAGAPVAAAPGEQGGAPDGGQGGGTRNGAAGAAPQAAEPEAVGSVAAIEGAPPRFERRVRFLRKDTEQFHVCAGGGGIPREDERRFALRVLEGVLGANSSSRLFQEVRERRGLAYSVFSFSNLYANSGEVGIYLGTRPDNLGEALSVLAQALERCVEDPASPEELERSRENLKGRVVLALESTGARMSRLGSSVLYGLPILSVDEMIERIDAVGIEQVRELAAELFAPSRLSLAGVGPDEDAFNEAIEPLSGGAGG